jgi:signal peptidase I
MDNNVVKKLIEIRRKSYRPFEITVQGVSMLPVLKHGDVITIQKQDNYRIGDILVFTYKSNELLVHRLLMIKNNKYYCKGDNALRLEDIKHEQIVGKVLSKVYNEKSDEIRCSKLKLKIICYFSLQINKVFVKSRYNIEKTKESFYYKISDFLYLSK